MGEVLQTDVRRFRHAPLDRSSTLFHRSCHHRGHLSRRRAQRQRPSLAELRPSSESFLSFPFPLAVAGRCTDRGGHRHRLFLLLPRSEKFKNYGFLQEHVSVFDLREREECVICHFRVPLVSEKERKREERV